MTGPIADLFVGGISVAIGAVLFLSGALNWERAFQFRKIHWMETRWGRPAARSALVIAGAALIALGVAIAMGFAPNAG